MKKFIFLPLISLCCLGEHFQFVPLKFKFYDVVKQCIPSFSEEDTP